MRDPAEMTDEEITVEVIALMRRYVELWLDHVWSLEYDGEADQ